MLGFIVRYYMNFPCGCITFPRLKRVIQGHTDKEGRIWNQTPGLTDSSSSFGDVFVKCQYSYNFWAERRP